MYLRSDVVELSYKDITGMLSDEFSVLLCLNLLNEG